MKRRRTNWKYISIVFILALIVGGFSFWHDKFLPKEEILSPGIKMPNKIEVTEALAEKVIDKIVIENYNRKTACFFIDDLNNDTISEIIVGFTPTSTIEQSVPNEAYLIVVTPTDETGNYIKKADFIFSKEEGISFFGTPCVRNINDLLDIDGDDKKEIILDLGTGGASNEAYGIFKIDWTSDKLNWLQIKTKDGTVTDSFFLKGAALMHQETFYLEDVDNDGVMETVEKFGAYIGSGQEGDWEKEENWKWEIYAYKWDGSIFNYNEELSNQLFQTKN